MTRIATIEDVLESILGLVLGAAPEAYSLATSGTGGGQGSDKTLINNAYRPATVRGAGSWLIAQKSTLSHTGDWAPEYDKDAVTFYTWQDSGFSHSIVRLTVWVGVVNRDNTQGQTANTNDPHQTVNPTANPVVSLGNAWELVRDEIPRVAGVGTSFDPNSIEAVREILGGLLTHATNISTELQSEIKLVNTKSPDFKGSAEAAWFHRVENADHYLSDLPDQQKRWDASLLAVENAMNAFIKALGDAVNTWNNITPIGTWQHPYRVIASMFNDSTLDFADVHGAGSNAWGLGTQYSDTGGEGDTDDFSTTDGEDARTPKIVVWHPPAWLNWHPFNAFVIDNWNQLEVHLRQLWADNLTTTFAPVLPKATDLVNAFAAARNPLYLADPAPVPPLPMPNTLGLPNGPDPNPFANFPNPFANFPNPFANFPNPFANFPNPFANFPNPFANFPNPFANVPNNVGIGGNNPFANGGGPNNPFANSPEHLFTTAGPNPFGNGPDTQFGIRSQNPFANTPDFLASDNPFAGGGPTPQTLGDLSPTQLDQLQADGLLNDVPLTPAQAAFLAQNGMPVPPGVTSLGQLTAQQLNALDKAGLLDRTPVSTGQLSDLGLGSPQTLGDLSPTQLHQLATDGLLNNVPLTPAESAFLAQDGLPVPAGVTSLGQLTPQQLDALQQGGFLGQTPLTAGELADLGLPTSSLPPLLSAGPTAPVVTNPFPTTVDGLDVTPPPAFVSGLPFGDVTGPGAAIYPGVGVATGTNGLSAVPGLSGKPGLLSSDGVGYTVGGIGSGAGGAGPGESGVDGLAGESVGGAAEGGMPFGGMPFMPGMFGGGGQSTKDRDRSRTTWLKEDEKVWGTDPDCAPAVIGRRGQSARPEDDEYPTSPDEGPDRPDERRRYRGR